MERLMGNAFSLDNMKLESLKGKASIKKQENLNNEIAIIGISGTLAGSNNLGEFWKNLENGTDCIRSIPETRMKDCEGIRKSLRPSDQNIEYIQSGYMDKIDKFDYELFSLSPKESALMDPNQRLFLQTAFSAIEDAGYGNEQLSGSRTGVFIGYSGDFGEEYKKYIHKTCPADIGLSIPGNIKSVIASRISYVLDLKGPSMVIDTACSSSLVAVHVACQSLRNDECKLALAGSVKINLLPLRESENHSIGIESSDDRTKTFDDRSDGTGSGEGVVVLLLKKLTQALEDRDNIYAVIKGSAINQDGSSNGLTAPNSEAQKEVILRAWENSGIHPKTISYIEAHGTGTKLGDPIEIRGIDKAFRQYTNKKQFCAIGSVKSNIGHLDHAAGIAGLTKVIFSLKNKKIPPSLHFMSPNRGIDFCNTPVYVNDRLRDWEAINGTRRCGINSFGLSGTNCHMILEEPPEAFTHTIDEVLHIFTLSAQSEDSLLEMVKRYHHMLKKSSDYTLQNICFTQNTGRGHYNTRLAMILTSIKDLQEKLEIILQNQRFDRDLPAMVFYGAHNLLPDNIKAIETNDLNLSTRRKLDKEADLLLAKVNPIKLEQEFLESITQLYVRGAVIHWKKLYNGIKYKRVSLPPYAFNQTRCWIDYQDNNTGIKLHPLIDKCVLETPNQKIFIKNYNPSTDWVLGQHIVSKKYVLPGTAFIETISSIATKYYGYEKHEIQNLVFSSPFIVDSDNTRELQILVKENNESLAISFSSRASSKSDWIKHSEGIVVPILDSTSKRIDLNLLQERMVLEDLFQFQKKKQGAIEVGERWESLRKIYFGENEFLADFTVANHFVDDLDSYRLYPPMLDDCVNIANKSLNGNDYLPFSYKSIRVYDILPQRVLSHIKRVNLTNNDEIVLFDVVIFDEAGKVLAEISEYSVRKMSKDIHMSRHKLFQQVRWVPSEEKPFPIGKKRKTCTLFFYNSNEPMISIMNEIASSSKDVVKIELGESYSKNSESSYIISGTLEDYKQLANDLSEKSVDQIIHGFNTTDETGEASIEDFNKYQNHSIYSLFFMTQAFIDTIFKNPVDIFLIANYANMVIEKQEKNNPHNSSFFGLAKVLPLEYKTLNIKCIDIDQSTAPFQILEEITRYKLKGSNAFDQVAYREGIRFKEQLDYLKIEAIEDRLLPIHNRATYLISGGMGALGLAVADHLAKKEKINLVLLGRTTLPPKETWENILVEGINKKLCHQIRMIKQIEEHGANVRLYSCDVSNMDSMQETLMKIGQDVGKISGIIHAAGIAGDGFIILKNEETFRNVVDVKTKGTWILEKLFRKDLPDFFISFSSISSFITQPGQGDYVAANQYLDSFTFLGKDSPTTKISINWAAWRDIGMAVHYGLENIEGIYSAISTDTALEAFDQVFSKKVSRIVIGEFNYNTLSKEKHKLPLELSHSILNDIKSLAKNDKNVAELSYKNQNTQVTILGKSINKITRTEEKLSQVWANVLGIDKIMIYKNFSDMGGDSILAIRLLEEMEKVFPSVLNISDIFTYPNVSSLSEYIDKKTNKTNKSIPAKSETKLGDYLEMLASGEIDTEKINSLLDLEDNETWT